MAAARPPAQCRRASRDSLPRAGVPTWKFCGTQIKLEFLLRHQALGQASTSAAVAQPLAATEMN
jgi:hypothetical protein